MSARIIIEKDGERYVANDLTARFIDGGRAFYIENNLSYDYISSTYTRLPPVIRTDNSEVIARLEAENAKLREALKPIMGCRTYPGKWMVKDDMTNKYFHIIRMAQDVMKGISRKDEDISRKGGAK